VSSDTNTTSTGIPPANLPCSKCGAALPEDAQFCLKCGKPVNSPPKPATSTDSGAETKAAPKPKRKLHLVLWLFLALFLFGVAWAVTSDNPWAQEMQELAGKKHDQSILETEAPFSIAAHSFRFYKFDLPEGSAHISVVGQFSAAPDTRGSKISNDAAPVDSSIEVYVLSEPAFAVWEKGYAASSVYESGKVQQGTLQANLPQDLGVYYLVFSNKADAKTAKKVTATILLHYNNWGPSWFRRFKDWIND
jgi:hypothetical protein